MEYNFEKYFQQCKIYWQKEHVEGHPSIFNFETTFKPKNKTETQQEARN